MDKVDKAIIKIKQISDDLDRSLCDPTCQLYDGRLCDIASNCERRRDWKVVTNSRLLSEKEICKICGSECEGTIAENCDWRDDKYGECHKLLAAQLAKTDKEWVEWAYSDCPHCHSAAKGRCPDCWANRMEEIGI